MGTMVTDRMSILKAELETLKKEQREKKAALLLENKWVSVKKSLPTHGPMQGSIRVIVWHEDQMKPCWYDEEKGVWSLYNGSYMIRDKDTIEGVTHWVRSDWMESTKWPMHGPGLLNLLRYYWQKVTDRAGDMACDLRPKSWNTKAQLDKKVTFYTNSRTGEVMTGLPEAFSAPDGYQKVVCNSAHEAERWSDRQRQWERGHHEKLQYQREMEEGPIRDQIHSDMRTLMANARNETNREFMRRSYEKSQQRHDPWKYERESYIHAEGHEQGH